MPSQVHYNPIAGECTIVPCLWQVAGHVDNNPVAHLSACSSLFGFPAVPTVFLPVDPILSTTIATSTYTDIIISTSTVYSTVEETSTSYESVLETSTEYTTTLVNTITTTVPASPTVTEKRRKRRRECKAKTSSKVSSVVSSVVPSSAVSSSAVSSSAASSSAVLSSAAPSSSALFADQCYDVGQYSSACACLEPATVTEYDAAVTSIVRQTESTTVPSTAGTVVTLAITTVIVNPATTTVTTTLTTLTETATTISQTAVPTLFGLVLKDGPNTNKGLARSGSAPTFSYAPTDGTPSGIYLTSPGTQPYLLYGSEYKMYIRLSTTSYGIVFWITTSAVATSSYTWIAVPCALDASGNFTCAANGLTRFLQCGAIMYMAKPTVTPGGCVEVHLEGRAGYFSA
ncbi:hypothetical protein B0H67DRAFT_347288 [Lasiosphaeris hirsuta]|uniref:Uncharacterized protein n=1 Tax=Lasiosphaeris hirsuta TaxID=260670 RepID=A0AA40DID7_9PEZI|nr:hypothetical protein B0H67DRAFT_347288 [Lasiosphaeris hirsuta]